MRRTQTASRWMASRVPSSKSWTLDFQPCGCKEEWPWRRSVRRGGVEYFAVDASWRFSAACFSELVGRTPFGPDIGMGMVVAWAGALADPCLPRRAELAGVAQLERLSEAGAADHSVVRRWLAGAAVIGVRGATTAIARRGGAMRSAAGAVGMRGAAADSTAALLGTDRSGPFGSELARVVPSSRFPPSALDLCSAPRHYEW